MPVLECACGMVMSVSAAKPRVSCIRCGGVELQVLVARREVASQNVERGEAALSITPNLGCSAELLQFDTRSLAPTVTGC